jgi:hypothetical protein
MSCATRSETGSMTSSSARSWRPIAACICRRTIDFCREYKRLFVCTEFPLSRFRSRPFARAAKGSHPTKFGAGSLRSVQRSSPGPTKHLRYGSKHLFAMEAPKRDAAGCEASGRATDQGTTCCCRCKKRAPHARSQVKEEPSQTGRSCIIDFALGRVAEMPHKVIMTAFFHYIRRAPRADGPVGRTL